MLLQVANIDRVLVACGLPDCEAFPIDADSMHAIIHEEQEMPRTSNGQASASSSS